ncbi:MAG: NAD(P)H-dependent oxidoreductase subunit E [Oscillospiraceae bacterium]|jgi:NADP-reducing hydrogenase subunit HndA|nr:NAD(P)H-dependent oxidoreductase subunit E [Oscillospiraceae bacterium]
MKKGKTNIVFQGTKEQEEQLLDFISRWKGEKGALMPILQKAQSIYGYLPIEVEEMIAEELNLSLEEVYGVVSFYSQFTLNPKGKYAISVCMGTACYVKGAQLILDELSKKLGIKPGGITPDGKYSLDATRCLGACGLAPVMVINGQVYGKLKVEDLDKILQKYN